MSRQSIAAVVSLGCLVTWISALQLQAADWPHLRGPDYNGVSKETKWKSKWSDKSPPEIWSRAVGVGASSVVVAGDCTAGIRFDIHNRNT